MIDGIFVFDNVIHAYDMSDDNLRSDVPDAQLSREQIIGDRAFAGYGDYPFAVRWSPENLYKLVFEDSPTDMAMAQVVPIFDWFKDWFAPVRAQHEMAEKYPGEVLFCGGVDPLFRGLPDALQQIDYQINELGAVSMKFYNGHIDAAWRCDDEELAYPLYERCRRNGVNVIQFHKGIPFGLQNVEDLRPNDLQKAARDFPDMIFVIHHLAIPYFEETVAIASRFPNVYLALSGTWSYYAISPRLLQKRIGRLLLDVGSDKLLWGSEAALAGPPLPYLEAFMELTIADDLRDGYGYPQITRDDKEKILGRNFARIMKVDISIPKAQ